VPSPSCARVSPAEADGGTGAASVLADGLRKADRLHHLSVDDAEFVEAVFERIITGVGMSGLCGAAAYVDRKVDALTRAEACPRACVPSSGARADGEAQSYRSGIAAVQAYCVATYESRFQHLPAWNQLAVLSVLEDCAERTTQPHALFFHVLVNDAVESYFDSATKQDELFGNLAAATR
jgi:hypothetical protein